MFSEVGAIIVTYNPGNEIFKLLEKLEKLEEVVIIDNNSRNKEILKEIKKKYPKTVLILNNLNEGLAKSYNKGERVFSEKIKWFFTFDQDSLPESSMIFEMKKYLKINNIGIISPKVIDLNIKKEDLKENDKEKEYEYINVAIQSGMCIKRECLLTVGKFEEELFMYYVDTDFCNKVRKKYKIIKVNRAILFHRDGNIQIKKLVRKFILNERSEVADYYRSRNLIYMMKNNGFEYIKDLIYDFFIKIIFSKNRKNYIKNTAKGIKDGIKKFL